MPNLAFPGKLLMGIMAGLGSQRIGLQCWLALQGISTSILRSQGPNFLSHCWREIQTQEGTVAFTTNQVLSVASLNISVLSQYSGGNWFWLLNVFFTKPRGRGVVYKWILWWILPRFLMGIGFEPFMSRLLMVFPVSHFPLLCEENASLYALSISWFLSAFTRTAENPIITSVWSQFLVALWFNVPRNVHLGFTVTSQWCHAAKTQIYTFQKMPHIRHSSQTTRFIWLDIWPWTNHNAQPTRKKKVQTTMWLSCSLLHKPLLPLSPEENRRKQKNVVLIASN